MVCKYLRKKILKISFSTFFFAFFLCFYYFLWEVLKLNVTFLMHTDLSENLALEYFKTRKKKVTFNCFFKKSVKIRLLLKKTYWGRKENFMQHTLVNLFSRILIFFSRILIFWISQTFPLTLPYKYLTIRCFIF